MCRRESQGLPAWAKELKQQFVSGTVSQFIVYGDTFDVFPHSRPDGSSRFLPLKQFLEDVMLGSYDTIMHYDRGKGIKVTRGDKEWSKWLDSLRPAAGPAALSPLSTRDPSRALELIDHYMLRELNLQVIRRKQGEESSLKLAVIIDMAQFIVPRGDPIQLMGDISSHIVKLLSWASDPAIMSSNILIILITEKQGDLNSLVVDNPHTAKIEIELPGENDILDYLKWLKKASFPRLEEMSDVKLPVMAKQLTGLGKVEARNVVAFALNNDNRITSKLLSDMKKEIIEKECQDLLEFIESPYTLDLVAGHEQAKKWLRDDGWLLRAGKLHALPMGYLVAGRIGTGKTFLVQCWAGELGIPCVVLKNFRSKWVGATEGNLEKIFSILKALGQAIVFVDEADQMTGRRGAGSSDSGVSGRVYGMLAKEMSDTRNRGRIIWVFATSRPDLLEVDLKRQGRLDVHIPLFPPQTQEEYHKLFMAVAKKLKFPLKKKDLPPIPEGVDYGGHEIEGILVRTLRIFELQAGRKVKKPMSDIFKQVMKEVKPSAHTRKMEYMDLVAVKECTDAGFLPKDLRDAAPEEIERRIDDLRRFM